MARDSLHPSSGEFGTGVGSDRAVGSSSEMSSSEISTTATAPGKIILAGEHSVVYGRPAIAIPVWEATANATISPASAGAGCTIVAHDLNRTVRLAEAPADDPLVLVVRNTLAHLNHHLAPEWRIEISSTIPIASGLGSGAAVSAAIIRAICRHVGVELEDAAVSQLVYEIETLHHGTPSGIDNTVIAYGMPVWYVKSELPKPFEAAESFTILIGDSGIVAPTKESVGDVRRGWQAQPAVYESLFDEIGALVLAARNCIEAGQIEQLGLLFDQNHQLLMSLDVSHPQLDTLVAAARASGALGAKLSGGGRGGNMIALVRPQDAAAVRKALLSAGAKRVLSTTT